MINAQPTEPITPTTRIVVDMRESSLYDGLRTLVEHDDAQYSWVSVETACLDIGDVHILPPNGHDKVIIERKTVQDVAASIQDGRWSEQKHRALANVPPHQLLYVIEVGNMSKLFDTMHVKMHGRIQYDTVMNAILHLWIRYRIPYVYLQGTTQSAHYLHRLAFQYHRQAIDTATRPSTQERYDQSLLQSHYHSVASQKRKNMTSLAFFRMTLQIIPGISQKTATNIQQLFEEGGFLSLVDFIRDHDKAMFHALYRTKYSRALNRDVVDTLYEYVLDTTPTPPAPPTTQPPPFHPNSQPRPRQSLLVPSPISSASPSSNI